MNKNAEKIVATEPLEEAELVTEPPTKITVIEEDETINKVEHFKSLDIDGATLMLKVENLLIQDTTLKNSEIAEILDASLNSIATYGSKIRAKIKNSHSNSDARKKDLKKLAAESLEMLASSKKGNKPSLQVNFTDGASAKKCEQSTSMIFLENSSLHVIVDMFNNILKHLDEDAAYDFDVRIKRNKGRLDARQITVPIRTETHT